MRGQGGGSFDPAEALNRARAAAEKALAIDDSLGDAHAIFGLIQFAGAFDWDGAERSFRRALELNPGSADVLDLYGQLLSALGRTDEAIEFCRRAQQLDPIAHRSDLSTELLRAGRIDDAIEAARAVVEYDPHARGYAVLGWARIMKGLTDEGVTDLEKAVAITPGDTMFLAQLGQAYAMVGRTDRAREILGQLQALAEARWVSPYHMAYVFTGLGENERALDCLEQAFELRAGAIHGIRCSFLFRTLHGHPRFTALLRRMNLA